MVGAAGRLDPVKDLETLIAAAALLSESQPRLRVVIVGEGDARAALEQQIRARGLSEIVTLAGYRHDVRDLLPAFDVYANTSAHEGVSLTILEAMAAAMPVVATRVGGTPEVVDRRRDRHPRAGARAGRRSPRRWPRWPRRSELRRAFGDAGRGARRSSISA